MAVASNYLIFKIFTIGVAVSATMLPVTVCFSQSDFNQSYGTEHDYKRLHFLNLQYIQSWIRSDTATYNHLLWADDFVHQNSSDGLLIPKKQIGAIFGKRRFKTIDYFYPQDVTVQFISNESAMVIARTVYKAIGDPDETASRYNDIYIKRDGQWKCVSANVTEISKQNNPPFICKKVPPARSLISHVPGSEVERKALIELNKQLINGVTFSKAEKVESILSPDFISIGSNGAVFKKQDVLEELKISAIPNTIEKYILENLSVRFVAPDIAMIHTAMISTFKDGIVIGTQINNIFVKRDGTWSCVSGNNTPIKN